MKVNVGKLPKVLFDEEGNAYDPLTMIPTGKLVTTKGKHGGWQYIVFGYMIRVTR